MPPTKKLTIAALLAVTVSVAGCNSKKASSTDSGSAATTAAAAPVASAANSGASAPAAAVTGAGAAASGGCPLTAAQVSTVMGATYGAPQNVNGMCFYTGSESLSIDVEDASGLHTFDAALAAAKESQGTDTTTTIPGLGDKATGVGQEIVVAAGGKTIDIRGADTSGAGWPKSIALAKLVIAVLH
jgi:hypothetical protein